MALQITVNKIFFRSKERSVAMMMRREIYQRLTGWREIKDMLNGYDDHKERLHETRPKIYHKRLIIPASCHTLLFLAQAIILVLSGQTLESHGSGTMPDYILQPGESGIEPEDLCREHLAEKRHTRINGSLRTCVKIQGYSKIFDFDQQMDDDVWFLNAYKSCYTNEFWFEIVRNKRTQSVYGSPISEETALTRVFVEILYNSYDGYTQTLLPFAEGPKDIPEGQTYGPLNITSGAWSETTIHEIYHQLALSFNVSTEDKLSPFGQLVEHESVYKMEGARIRLGDVDDEGKDIGEALANILLYKMKLVELPDRKMYSFDPRTGKYGPEKGQGPRLYEKNIVPQWVYIACIVVLSIVSFIFSKIQNEDPEFYLYRAFLEANNMNPKLGPLAQPLDKNNDVFYFGSLKKGGLFARFKLTLDKLRKSRVDKSPGTSPSSSKGSESPKENFFAKLLPGDSHETCGTLEETPKKKDKKEEEGIPLARFCGADFGCFNV